MMAPSSIVKSIRFGSCRAGLSAAAAKWNPFGEQVIALGPMASINVPWIEVLSGKVSNVGRGYPTNRKERVFFFVHKPQQAIVVLGAIKKENNGPTPLGAKVVMKRRKRLYLSGAFGNASLSGAGASKNSTKLE